jgi:hypothetical protein
VKPSRRVASVALATAIAIGGSVSLAPQAQADTLLAGFWEGANATGAQRNIRHPSSGHVCTASLSDFDGRATITGTFFGFNNTIESFFGNFEADCWVKLWDSSTWTGSNTFGYTQQAATLPSSINNQTSSAGVS